MFWPRYRTIVLLLIIERIMYAHPNDGDAERFWNLNFEYRTIHEFVPFEVTFNQFQIK